MRIGYLVSQYPATSHTFIQREVAELRRQGQTIETFSIRRPAADECRSEPNSSAQSETFYVLGVSPQRILLTHIEALGGHPLLYIKVLALAVSHRAPGLRAFIWSLFHFAEGIVLARELKARGIRRLHNHFANSAASVGLVASSFLQIPWSMTLHGVSETDYPAGLLLANKIKCCDFVACASWFVRAQAMRVTPPEQWPKLFIVRCGLSLCRMPKLISRKTDVRLKIVCVGRLSPEKGQLGLLHAYSKFSEIHACADLVFVGDGPDRPLIEQAILSRKLEKKVRLTGRLDEESTLRAIADSDLLVLPSFMEGLPVVLMEAMALGAPVVAAHVAGIPELVQSGENGLLFRPSDWDDLAHKILILLRDERLRARYAAAARRSIEQDFAIERAVEPLIARFKSRNAQTSASTAATSAPDKLARANRLPLHDNTRRGAG